MQNANENHRVEDGARNSYDVRLRAVETDVAVMKTSFATKEDVERIVSLLYQHKLEFIGALATQREEFTLAMTRQREEFMLAMARQREELHAALAKQSEQTNAALARQSESLSAAILKQNEYLNASMSRQNEDFRATVARLELKVTNDLAQTKIDLYTIHMNHMWKLYSAASLLVAGVYFIARYVH